MRTPTGSDAHAALIGNNMHATSIKRIDFPIQISLMQIHCV